MPAGGRLTAEVATLQHVAVNAGQNNAMAQVGEGAVAKVNGTMNLALWSSSDQLKDY